MLFHRMESRDIRVNLATEDYLMNHYQINEPLFLMYIQAPCVIVGRNQNVFDEVKLKHLEEDEVVLTRRLSGGGAVYEDLGNISFSFVGEKEQLTFGDYTSIVRPIVEGLQAMGVENVAVNGRNDILIGDKKISGNAMYTKKGKTFSHGTLMYDVDLTKLPEYLNVSKEKLAAKGIQSVTSRVTNIKPFLTSAYQQLTIEGFRDELIRRIYQIENLSEVAHKEIILTKSDQEAINQKVETIYGNEEWVYGHHEPFTMKSRQYIPNVGLLEARFQIVEGKMSQVNFLCDYFGEKDSHQLAEKLEETEFKISSLKNRLKDVQVSDYFSRLEESTFIDFLMRGLPND